MSRSQEKPPVMWTRCHVCGKAVRTDEVVRRKAQKNVFNGPSTGLLRINECGYIDLCIRCDKDEKAETGDITEKEVDAIQSVIIYTGVICIAGFATLFLGFYGFCLFISQVSK